MRTILLVSERSEGDAAALLEEEIRAAFKGTTGGVRVETVGSQKIVKDMLPGDIALVITPMHIRETLTSPFSLNEVRGLELLRWMETSGMKIPGILIAPTFTEELRAAQPYLSGCIVVYTGGTMIEDVVKRAKQLILDARTPKCLDVEIHLRTKTEWWYKIVGNGFLWESPERVLKIDESTLDNMSWSSDSLGTSDQWQTILQRIGVTLRDTIEKNPFFHYDMLDGSTEAGLRLPETDTRVRFFVDRELHGLAVEAVRHPTLRDKYWMLEAPVYRRLTTAHSAAGTLFEGGPRINSLIIDAPVSGWVESLGKQLGKLPNVSSECRWLAEMLEGLKNNFNMSSPVILSCQGETKPTAQNVKKALESHPWSVVHYAGHSYYDSEADTGYIFLPGDTDGSIETVDMRRFSDWLRKSTFTYLSSCDSGTGAFIFELARRQVPNIVGFRWPINDLLAFEYSREFYDHLFATRSLERAFLKARQKMHERHPDSRIWAAPVLIKQLGES